jgi:hypothetical protein
MHASGPNSILAQHHNRIFNQIQKPLRQRRRHPDCARSGPAVETAGQVASTDSPIATEI